MAMVVSLWNFYGLKPEPGKEERSTAVALYREYFAVTSSNRIGFPSPIVIYPCEFPDTWRYIKLLYFIRPAGGGGALR